jgi:hypothetical protein
MSCSGRLVHFAICPDVGNPQADARGARGPASPRSSSSLYNCGIIAQLHRPVPALKVRQHLCRNVHPFACRARHHVEDGTDRQGAGSRIRRDCSNGKCFGLGTAQQVRVSAHSVWKEKKPTFYSDVKCCAGWAYRIDKIHSLTARFGCPTGSLQLSKAAMIVRIKQDDEPTNMGTDQSTSRPDTGSELAVANAPESTAKAASMVVTSAMQSSQEKTDRHSGSSNAIYATSGAETASPTEQGTLPAPIGVVPLLERSSPRSGCQDSKITANPDHSNQNKATSTAARALEFSTPKRKSHVLTERIQSASPGKRVRLHKA